MNDFEIHKYTEQKNIKHSKTKIREFVKEKINLKMNSYMEYF